MPKNKFTQNLSENRAIEKQVYDVVFAESGGGNPEEIAAVANTILNRVDSVGLQKALSGFSSFKKKSPEYRKASTGNLNGYEKMFYNSVTSIVNNVANNPETRKPYWYMENVDEFGPPPWLSDTKNPVGIGRQVFYERK